jgi:hypothetical protein
MELVGGTSGVKTLDDGYMVLRITDVDTQSLQLVETKDGVSKTYNYSFSGLELMPSQD